MKWYLDEKADSIYQQQLLQRHQQQQQQQTVIQLGLRVYGGRY